jgi:hypothetical protein
VTILGRGDLAPQHNQSTVVRWVVGVLVLLLLAAGGYAAVLGLSGKSKTVKPVVAALPTCAAAKIPGPTNPHQVHLVVLNATLTSGLAARVSTQLKARGFHVSRVGNTPRLGKGIATIHYSAGQELQAQSIADQIHGAALVQGPSARLELDLGPGFHALATPAQVKAARSQFISAHAGASPSPTSTPAPGARPTPGPTCTPAAHPAS